MLCTIQVGAPHLLHHSLDNLKYLEVEHAIQQVSLEKSSVTDCRNPFQCYFFGAKHKSLTGLQSFSDVFATTTSRLPDFEIPAHMRSGSIHCLGSKPFRLQGYSVLSGRPHAHKSKSFCSLMLSRNVHSTRPSEVNLTMPLMDAGSSELNFGVATDLHQQINAAASQKASELSLADLKKEFDRVERPLLAASCLILPNHLRHKSTEFVHTQDHKRMKCIPKYLSSRDIMLAKKQLLKRDWIRLRDQIISSRVYVVENMQSTFSNIEKLYYDYGVKGPSDGMDIYKGECDAAFDRSGAATLAFIIWKDDKVIWSEIIRDFICSSILEAEACAALALVWKAQQFREIKNLTIYTDSSHNYGIMSGSLTIKQNDKNYGLYMLLRGARVCFDKFMPQWKPRDLLFLPDALASSDNFGCGPLCMGTTLKKFSHHLSGLPIFKLTPSTKAKEMTNKFVVKPYNEPVESAFYLVVDDEEKFEALTNVMKTLKPSVVYACIRNIEHKPSDFRQKMYDSFIPAQIGEFADIYYVKSILEPKDTDHTGPQGVRSINFVFDATVPEASYAHLDAFTIFLVSPEERMIMSSRGIKELNALSYIYYHGVIEDKVQNLSAEAEGDGGGESGEVLVVSLSHPMYWWGPDLAFPRRDDILKIY